MKRMVLAAALFGVLLGVGAAATAADFHVLYISREEQWVELLDPSTIATLKDGHKTARTAEVGTTDMWTDYRFEFDCAAKRTLTSSAIFHEMNGETLDRSKQPGFGVGEWQTAKEGTLAMLRLETVCAWPKAKDADSTISTTDFAAAIKRASSLMTRWWAEDHGVK